MCLQNLMNQDIKESKRYGHTVGRSDFWTDGQRENIILSHKHSLRGYNKMHYLAQMSTTRDLSVSILILVVRLNAGSITSVSTLNDTDTCNQTLHLKTIKRVSMSNVVATWNVTET